MKTIQFIILIILLSISINSCKNGVAIIVDNNSNELIDSLIISNDFFKVKHLSLKKNQRFKTFADFNLNNNKNDGIFNLTFYSNKKTQRFNFGYYSNGTPPSKDLIIKVLNDSIYVVQKK